MVDLIPGWFSFSQDSIISTGLGLSIAVEQIQHDLKSQFGLNIPVVTAQSNVNDLSAIRLEIDPSLFSHPQGYYLSIKPNLILIKGIDNAGLYYGVQTLRQIILQSKGGKLPCMEIKDWPDFLNRGVMLDISRDKVYSMETLKMLIDEFSSWKFNQLQLYTEHTFAYKGHELVWKNSSPLTPEEIQELDRYCSERFIELVPNQNSFGHMSRWLVHSEYQYLAETTKPVRTPWNTIQIEPYSLAPVLPESLEFVSSLYDQLLPNFSSKIINIGCDETFDIGTGLSKDAVKEKGVGQVYVDYLLSLYRNLKQRGYTMQFWGDIILEHPELIPQLPQDSIALNWGYEADHPFENETEKFKNAGIPYYVCPGTSSWNTIAGRTENMMENIRNASYYGMKNGACGFLVTDWGDNGHWQQLPISYPGLAYAAQQAWLSDKGSMDSLSKVLDKIVFRDSSETIGKFLLDLGQLYQAWGKKIHNSSPLFWTLQLNTDEIISRSNVDPKIIRMTLEDLTNNETVLGNFQLQRSDANLIYDELNITIQLLKLACRRLLTLINPQDPSSYNINLHEVDVIIDEYSRLWKLRNRPGGLQDSLKRFDALISEVKNQN